MQQVFLKNLSQSFFSSSNPKQDIFAAAQTAQNTFSFIQPGQCSKYKILKVNTEEAKSIFLSLNKKNSHKQASFKKNWKLEETSLLIYLVEKLFILKKVKNVTDLSPGIWRQIEEFLPGKSARDCKYKVLSMTASTITDIPWSAEERNILTQIIEVEGLNWNIVSQKLYQRSDKKVFRTSKQCREHFMCFLKPNLKKGAWTEEQDYRLVCFFLEYGRRWSKIMKFIEGRNQNSIKNRFFLLFQNKRKTLNQSDLLRKIKRKKQQIEKKLKDKTLNFKSSVQEKGLKEIVSNENSEKVSENQLEKSVIEGQTIKGEDHELRDYFTNHKDNIQQSEKEFQESMQSTNRLTSNNLKSYQHLDFPQFDFGVKQASSIEFFESFEQYICF